MNDRFKFRVWNKNTHSFTTGGAIKFGGLCFVDEEDFGIKLGEHQECYIIEQCTGLKDKNGKLIYEGDLIIAPNNSHKLAIIRMENGVYGCKECRFNGVWEMNLYDLIKHYGVEIIGNIHETKDIK